MVEFTRNNENSLRSTLVQQLIIQDWLAVTDDNRHAITASNFSK